MGILVNILSIQLVLALSLLLMREHNCDTKVLSTLSIRSRQSKRNETISWISDDTNEGELSVEGNIRTMYFLKFNDTHMHVQTITYIADKNGNRVVYRFELLPIIKTDRLSPAALKSAAG